jgi:hypothetical protein
MMRALLLLCFLAGCSVAQADEPCTCDPRRISDVVPPVPDVGELMVWHDPYSGDVRLLYRDPVNGTVAVLLPEQ